MVAIGKRKKELILEELRKAGKQIVSISKLNTMENCPYEAYLNYVLHKKGNENVYTVLGSIFHDELQKIMEGNSSTTSLPDVLKESLKKIEVIGLDFPKDRQGGTTIRNAWLADMNHFCKTFIPPKGNFTTEEFCLLKVTDDLYLQGYIDLIQHHCGGQISIWDWKTSSKFQKKDLLHHGRQLVLYAMAREQEGISVRNIGWIMLKYASVTYTGKARANSKTESKITKVVNRGKLVKELEQNLKEDLLHSGADEILTDCLLEQAIESNDINILPKEIVSRYTIKPYVQKYELTEGTRAEAIAYVKQQSAKFLECGEEKSHYPPREFFRYGRDGKKQPDVFYCSQLCGFKQYCEHYQDYKKKELNKRSTENDEWMDLF